MGIKYSEQSRIFRDFRSIPYSDYYYLIRFYEQYYKDIDYLPFDESLIMSYYYANALFETGEYDTHLTIANHILEQSMINNVRYIDGEDVYITILYQKACAHLKLGELQSAKRFATQLVRMDTNNPTYSELLRLCFIVERPAWIRITLMTSTCASLMAALATIILSLFHSFPSQAVIMPYSLLFLAAIGLSATAIGYFKHIQYPLNKVMQQAKASPNQDL